MGSFLPVDIQIAISEYGTAHRTNAHRLILHAHLLDDLGNELMNYAMRTARTVMHRGIVHQRRLLIYQIPTGIKRLWPDRLVFTYQGDGDLACIGTCETIHALNRGEHIAIIFINNAIYGMTGGQMAPTTLLGQKTATCPYGRDADLHGYPLNITELASHLQGTCYVTRQSVETVASIRKAKKAIRKAFEASMQGKGSSLVEIVSTCNSGWKLSPVEANKWMEENMFKQYPKGDLKDTTGM